MGGKNEFSVYFPVDGESDMNVEHINVQYAVMEGGGKWLPGGTSLQFPVELDQFFFIHPASPLESAGRFKQVNALNFVGLSFFFFGINVHAWVRRVSKNVLPTRAAAGTTEESIFAVKMTNISNYF